MNKDTIKFDKIIFTNGITIGEDIQGYIILTLQKPLLLKSLHLNLSSVLYTGTTSSSSPTSSIFLDDEPNEKNWNGIQRIVKNTEKHPKNYCFFWKNPL